MTLAMTRKNFMAILIAVMTVLVALASINQVHAANNTVEITGIAVDFSHGQFTIMYSNDNELVIPATLKHSDQSVTNEDELLVSNELTGTLDLDSGHVFFYSSQYGRMFEYTAERIVNTVTISDDTIDGVAVQFQTVHQNGVATLVKNANAYSTNGIGYLLQDGNVITFTAFNNETLHRIYMPLMNN